MIGFSAGGQLAHRTFIYSNTNYCNKTIAMGSGWYTTINENLDFPYGLNGSPYDSSLTSIFSKDLTILVGENDNDPSPPPNVGTGGTWAHGTLVAGLLAGTTNNNLECFI